MLPLIRPKKTGEAPFYKLADLFDYVNKPVLYNRGIGDCTMPQHRVKEVRERFGLTQDELAQALRISKRAVTYWEAGNMPGVDSFVELAKYFDVSIDYLIGISDDPKGSLDGAKLSTRERAVLAAWRRGDRLEAIEVIANDRNNDGRKLT